VSQCCAYRRSAVGEGWVGWSERAGVRKAGLARASLELA